MKRRVVVTGLGVVSSIGIGKDEFWKNLIAGKSGISSLATFDTADYPVHKGGEVKNFSPAKFIQKEALKDMARASQFAIAAAKMALEDAGLSIEVMENKSVGIVMGTTMADVQSLEQIDKYWVRNGEYDVWKTNIQKYPANNLCNQISFCMGLRGLSFTIPTACAAGNYSIGFAYDLISNNKADFGIVGGADPISRTNFTGFNRLVAMAPDICQPFDRSRKGMMVGEGAGVLILETLESALSRSANIHAEILGYGLSCDANNMTSPSVEGIVKVMKKVIRNAGISEDKVDYISAHGTGTLANDKAECEGIRRVFGAGIKNVAVSSIKSMIGHTMGAASAIEAISCCLAIENNIIPPTINYTNPDPECDIDCVPNKLRMKEVSVALNNSLAFGGNNACLALGEYE